MSSLLGIASFAGLGGFLFGYDLGLIAGALLYMDSDSHLDLTTESSELIVGMAKLGAVFGTFIGGALMVDVGRKNAIATTGVFFIAGPCVMAFSTNAFGLCVGRVIVGLGVGSSAVCVPAYVAEIAPPETRGALVVTYELMLCVGMLASGIFNYALKSVANNWRWMVFVPALPAVLMVFGLVLLPESPRWLVVNGKLREALEILHALREGSGSARADADASTARVETELMELWSAVEKERSEREENTPRVVVQDDERDLSTIDQESDEATTSSIPTFTFARRYRRRRFNAAETNGTGTGTYIGIGTVYPYCTGTGKGLGSFAKTVRAVVRDARALAFDAKCPDSRPFRVAAALAFFNQAMCSTSVVNYAPLLLQRVGVRSRDDAVLFASLLSVAKFLGVATSFKAVDTLGRKPLLARGSVGCCLAMLSLSVAFHFKNAPSALTSMCLFMFSFSASWAGVFWVLVSELFTMRWKSPAVSTATAVLFTTGAAVDFVFLSAAEKLGAAAFVLVALVSLASGTYALARVPETKGKTLGEIQRGFREDSSLVRGDGTNAPRNGSGRLGFCEPRRGRYVAVTEVEPSGSPETLQDAPETTSGEGPIT